MNNMFEICHVTSQYLFSTFTKIYTVGYHCFVKIMPSLSVSYQFKLTSTLGFLFANKREDFFTASVVPGLLINHHSHTVVVFILVVWLIGSPLSVSCVTTVWPMKSSFWVDVIQTDPYSTKWIWKRFNPNIKMGLVTFVQKKIRKTFTMTPKSK